MLDLKILEELRTKEELIEYFKQLGKEITEEEIIALKQSYEQADENRDELSLQQLDDVVGGIYVRIVVRGINGSVYKVNRSFEFKKDGTQINNWVLLKLFGSDHTRAFSVAKTDATRKLNEKDLKQLENETLQIVHYDANGNFGFETINIRNYDADLTADQVGRVIAVAIEVLVNRHIDISDSARENLCRFLVYNSSVRKVWMNNSRLYLPPAPVPPPPQIKFLSVVTPDNTQPNAQASANASLPTGAFGGIPLIQEKLKIFNTSSYHVASSDKDYSEYNPPRSELRKLEKFNF